MSTVNTVNQYSRVLEVHGNSGVGSKQVDFRKREMIMGA